MPCDQVRTTTLEIDAASLDVMAEALRSLGLDALVDVAQRTIRVTASTGQSGYWANGLLVMNGMTLDQNEVRRAYSKASIVQTARRSGWQLRFQSSGEITATRRSFA